MIGRIGRSICTFARIARDDPRHAFDLTQLRLERMLKTSVHFVDPLRLATRRFEVANTFEPAADLVWYGNYLLARGLIPQEPIVFSLGVGEDVRFDRALIERHGANVSLFDPTPRSARYVAEQADLRNARFEQLAVADHDGELEVFIDDFEDSMETTTSVSVVSRGGRTPLAVPCRTIATLMAERGVAHLDILKLDVEGAGIRILRSVLDAGILPMQIAGEFERPPRAAELRDYLTALGELFSRLRDVGYTLYRTRPDAKGFQVQILAVRRLGHAAMKG